MVTEVIGLVGNPYSVAAAKAQKTGRILASVLQERVLGRRPVTLVGFSLGTRVVVEALHALREAEAPGLVDSVVLLGGATPRSRLTPELREMVAGELVNVYAENDWVLATLFRAAELANPIGLGPSEVDGVIDVEVTDLVTGHLGYAGEAMNAVLQRARAAVEASLPGKVDRAPRRLADFARSPLSAWILSGSFHQS
jgi:pimeloyl-ACP methyl ester carboxylesterase